MRAKSLPITMEALRLWAFHIESALAQGGCFSPPRRLGDKGALCVPFTRTPPFFCVFKAKKYESRSPPVCSPPPSSSPEDDLFDNVIKCCACSGQQRHLQTSSTSEKQQWAFVAKFYRRWIYLFISLVMTPFFLQFISNMFILFLCLVWTSSKDNEHYEIHSKCVRAQSSSV